MCRKKLCLIVLLLLTFTKALPAVFVVTSNADSGPGTLREALTLAAANGAATTDYINFNLPDLSIAGRTINVVGQLPDISSNLVIDGSTQPGVRFGVSDAKICLSFNSTGQNKFAALTIKNQSDIKIYGLYIRLTNTFEPLTSQPIGLSVTGTDNLQLGDAQKGNVIDGFHYPLEENADVAIQSNNLVLKCNFFNIQPDGLTGGHNRPPIIDNVRNVIVGGAANEGNLFAMGFWYQMIDLTKPFTCLFKNNKAGVNYNLSSAFATEGVRIMAGDDKSGYTHNTANTIVNVEDNILSADKGNDIFILALEFVRLGGVANVVRNYFGVDKNKNQVGNLSDGVYVQYCKEVHIGDNDINDANYMGYCHPVFADNTGDLTITKNSFFCTTGNQVYYDYLGEVRPLCNVTSMTTTGVTGTAPPNALVDLYYSDRCKTCATQTYFASVTADASGNWSYNAPLSGIVLAIATINNQSTESTYPHIDDSGVVVTDACGGKGSVTGIKTFGAINKKWIDADGNIVGTDDDLLDVKAGKYRLFIDNGGCADSTDYYEINPKFTLDKSNAVIKMPACGDSAGAISGLSLIIDDKKKVNLVWTDAGGKIWGNDLEVKGLPPGSYQLTATGVDGCVQIYGPVTLPDINNIIPPPVVNTVRPCTTGDAFIKVNDPSSSYIYRLYDSETDASPMDEQKNGVFKVPTTKDRLYYVSAIYFNCESQRSAVMVYTGLNLSLIPNVFTPNGDGINDYWNIPGIETFPAALISVFSRSGQKVFESRGYDHPFGGTEGGKLLPAGTYYYVINLSKECRFVSGNLTIIR